MSILCPIFLQKVNIWINMKKITGFYQKVTIRHNGLSFTNNKLNRIRRIKSIQKIQSNNNQYQPPIIFPQLRWSVSKLKAITRWEMTLRIQVKKFKLIKLYVLIFQYSINLIRKAKMIKRYFLRSKVNKKFLRKEVIKNLKLILKF